MSISIHTKNIDLNPESERYIHKKFNRIQRHLPNMGDAKLEVSRTRVRATPDRIRARMTLNVSGHTFRGHDSGVNLYAAVDNVADVMDGQIRRFKGKFKARKDRRGARDVSDAILDMSERP